MLCQSIGDAGSLLPARRSSQAVAFGPIQSTWGEPRRLLFAKCNDSHSSLHRHEHDRGQNPVSTAPSAHRRRQFIMVSRPRTQVYRCQRSQLPACHADLQIRTNDTFSLYPCYTARVMLQAEALSNPEQGTITLIYAIYAAT